MSGKKSNKKTKQNKNLNIKDSETYPSAKSMLSEIKDIYKNENERNRNLENKASIGITILGVLLTISVNGLNLKKLINIKIENFSNILLGLLLILILFIMVIMIVLILYNFYQVIKPKSYKNMSTDGFIQENAECDEDIISMNLINIYRDIINHNKKINDEKSDFIAKGMRYLITCIFLYVIYALVYPFI